jgi:hypothetical protein
MGSALPRPEGLLKMEYVPREQFVPFHKRKQRHSVLVTHRRCGKTVASICDLIGKAIKHPPARQGFEGGRFAYIATTYAAGKDIAWEMLKAYSRPFIAELPNESELRVDFLEWRADQDLRQRQSRRPARPRVRHGGLR